MLTSSQGLTLSDVQQKVLDDRTLLLEYALQPDASYLWAVSKADVSLYKLPARSNLDKAATDLRAQLIPSTLQRRIVGIDVIDPNRGIGLAASAPSDAGPFVAASTRFTNSRWNRPPALWRKRLLIVADGALSYVPFEVFLKTAAAGDFSSLPYLIKSNEIVYAPSASVVAAIRQQRSKASGRAMLIIADPVFNSNDARARKGTTTNSGDSELRGLGIQSALADVTGDNAAATADAKMEGLPLARLAGTRAEARRSPNLLKVRVDKPTSG